MDWFEELFGFRETDPPTVYSHLAVEGSTLRSSANGKSYGIGRLETPTLDELRSRANHSAERENKALRVRNVVGGAGELHAVEENAGAFFQVASQFNLLEMVGPGVTPEQGVSKYGHDNTQGPACAIAAGAATVYRNYFAPVDGGIGQTAERQIDCLRDLHDALSVDGSRLWKMSNGYSLCTEDGIARINDRLSSLDESGRDSIRGKLRIGLHWDVEVTNSASAHCVSQAFCSALPVAYSNLPSSEWADFARLVLEASYEATLLAGIENAARSGNGPVFLTQLGGGAFGNETQWIVAAMKRAFELTAGYGLDLRIVHYRDVDPACSVFDDG